MSRRAVVVTRHENAFPFKHEDLVHALLNESRGLRCITGAYEVLHEIITRGEMYFRSSQCSLNKALEKVGASICLTFGQTLHPRYWRTVKRLCNQGPTDRNRQGTRAVGKPHPYMPCMMTGLVMNQVHGQTVWVIASESWIASPRPWIAPGTSVVIDDTQHRRTTMNFYIVEAIVHHQLDHPTLWKHVPDFDVIFTALTFARRGSDDLFSAELASHFASMAIRYDADESRHGSAAFKGLRRWRNVCAETITKLTLRSIWGFRETPRHHQLWHLHRLLHGKKIQDMQSTLHEAIFVLLVTIINDHFFATIPPEDAAACVINALFTKYDLTNKQRVDMARIHAALRQPRSPYLSVLFPEVCNIPVETWQTKLNVPPLPPPAPRGS